MILWVDQEALFCGNGWGSGLAARFTVALLTWKGVGDGYLMGAQLRVLARGLGSSIWQPGLSKWLLNLPQSIVIGF